MKKMPVSIYYYIHLYNMLKLQVGVCGLTADVRGIVPTRVIII